MDFSYLFLFLLACVGMCHIIVDGSIMQWFRNMVHWLSIKTGWEWLDKLIGCYACTGFHVSWILSLFWNPLPIPWYYAMFFLGFAGSYCSMLGAALLNYLDRPWGQNDK